MKNANFIDRTGEKHITNQGYEIEILEYIGSGNCTILLDNKLTIKNVSYRNIKKGHINNPFHPKAYNNGYMGIGEYSSKNNGSKTKAYNLWISIFKRSYSDVYHEKYPTYKNVTVCEEWKCFQNFAKWFYENYKPHMEGWHLDKDILVKGNKLYSPETCIFIPNELNCVFTNRVDNKNKIKALERFKDFIPIKVYKSLILNLTKNL